MTTKGTRIDGMDADSARENLAEWFSEGPGSQRFIELEIDADANVGGELVTIPFYLSRLLGENLFTLPWNVVLDKLETLIASQTSAQGASVVQACGGDRVVLGLLRLRYDEYFRPKQANVTKPLAILKTLLQFPNATVDEIAASAETTRKQVLRNSDTMYAMRLLREAGARTAHYSSDK